MRAERFKIIAFTHKCIEVEDLHRFFIPEDDLLSRLSAIRSACGMEEIQYISTCNRIEFLFLSSSEASPAFLQEFFSALNPSWNKEDIAWNISHCLVFSGEEAVSHHLEVISSLDSLVVGEREILAQVRKSYDVCKGLGLTGDFLRLLNNAAVKTAKEVYTHTRIAEKSVSVVFLAYQMLRSLNVRLDARFIIVGSGQTNATFSKYLLKHGFKNFTVFNRSLDNARKLALELKGEAFSLQDLNSYKGGFDVLISCTASQDPVITESVYNQLKSGEKGSRIIIDLAIPSDIENSVKESSEVKYIGISALKERAAQNLSEREKELDGALAIISENLIHFRKLIRHRELELALKAVPQQIKEVRKQATDTVFAREIGQLDDQSREILEKVLGYMEKKCISIPMLVAKEILLEKE